MFLQGREGTLCGSCSAEYFSFHGHCEPCKQFSSSYDITMPFMNIGVLIGWYGVVQLVEFLDAFDVSLHFLQILHLIGNFHAYWPAEFSGVFGYLSVAILDIDIISPACYLRRSWEFRERFFTQNLLPLAFAFMVVFKTVFQHIFRRLRKRRHPDWQVLAIEVREAVLSKVMAFLNVAYPALCHVSFPVFVCRDAAGVSVLSAQPNIVCGSERHNVRVVCEGGRRRRSIHLS